MNAPRPSFTPSRLNVGGYGVRVLHSTRLDLPAKASLVTALDYLGRATLSFKESGGTLGRKADGIYVITTQGATVTPDGSLSIEPEPWAPRHYRRAVMRGAGVYQAGLWAMLAGRAQADAAQVVEGAALGVNDAQVLDRFVRAAHGRVRHSVRWRTPFKLRVHKAFSCLATVSPHGMENCIHIPRLSSGRPKSRTRRSWARGEARLKAFCRHYDSLTHLFPNPRYLIDPKDDQTWDSEKVASKEYTLHFLKAELKTPPESDNALRRAARKVGELEAPSAALYAALTGQRAGLKVALLIVKTVKARLSLGTLLSRLMTQGDRYRAHLARLIKPQRAPRRAPRPLYSRAIPPAAPLAPPALA